MPKLDDHFFNTPCIKRAQFKTESLVQGKIVLINHLKIWMPFILSAFLLYGLFILTLLPNTAKNLQKNININLKQFAPIVS